MTDLQLSQLLYFSIIIGFFLVIYLWSRVTGKRELEHFKLLKKKYPNSKHSIDEHGYYGAKGGHLLQGNIEKMPFICSTFITGSGRSTCFWTEFKINHQLNLSYRLKLTNEYFFHKVGKSTHLVKEIEVGDEKFDKMFLIQSEDISTSKRLLNASIRRQLMAVPKLYFGEITINDSQICYKAGYHLDNKKGYQYFEANLDIINLLLKELKQIA